MKQEGITENNKNLQTFPQNHCYSEFIYWVAQVKFPLVKIQPLELRVGMMSQPFLHPSNSYSSTHNLLKP